ncbi:MAG: hypothetical protein O7G85_05880, partial [Planctomycetota bacterium]|nr:hypothetical protein [Planctomycetota bacterium]
MSNTQNESNDYNSQNNSTGTELAEHEGTPQTMPIGVGGFGESDNLPPLVDEDGSKVNSSAFVIAFVLVCTSGVIFWMRSTSANHNSAFNANAEVESQVESILQTM